MFRSRLALVAALSMIGLPAPGMSQPAPVVTANAPRKAKRGLFNDVILPRSSSWYGTKGAGITMAQQKRASRKARNVAKHKARVRG